MSKGISIYEKDDDVTVTQHINENKITFSGWWVTVVTATVSMAFIPTATVARLSASLKLVSIRVTTPEII